MREELVNTAVERVKSSRLLNSGVCDYRKENTSRTDQINMQSDTVTLRLNLSSLYQNNLSLTYIDI